MYRDQVLRSSIQWPPVRLALTIATVALILAILAISGAGVGALCLLPALILALPLLMRRYPGERLIVRMAARRSQRWPRSSSSTPCARGVFALIVRGGLLIASALANRPPPLAH
jgi:hypothetical protein